MNQALKYASDMHPMVQRGIKTSTIREATDLTPGDVITHTLADGSLSTTSVALAVRQIEIRYEPFCQPVWIAVDGVKLGPADMRALSVREGFGSAVIIMVKRIGQIYRLPFTGVLIQW